MLGWDLTHGQRRVRELAAPLIPHFVAATDADDKDALSDIYANLRARLGGDSVVRQDLITGADLKARPLSRHYVNWVRSVSKPTTTDGRAACVRFDRFVLGRYANGDSEESGPEPAYLGGEKNTTMWAVLTIVAGLGVAEEGMDPEYFTRSGILTTDGDGTHRLLAHVLTGEPRIPGLVRKEERELDPALNSAFLSVEELCPGSSFYVWKRPPEIRDREVEAVRRFASMAANNDERRVIGAFLRARYTHPRTSQVAWKDVFPGKAQTPIEVLDVCLRELREIRGRNVLSRLLIVMQRGLGRRQPASAFERWMSEEGAKFDNLQW